MNAATIVTGAGGFVGHALAARILRDGGTVIGVTRNADGVADLARDPGFRCVVADFSSYADLGAGIEAAAADLGCAPGVFHHMAWAGFSGSELADYAAHLDAARAACDAVNVAADLGCPRFVYAGTVNHFEVMNQLRIDDVEPRPTCIYATGKTAAELMCKTIAVQRGIELCVGLPAMLYGEGNRARNLGTIVIRAIAAGEAPALIAGEGPYDLVYIDDVVEAFLAIASRGKNLKSYYIGHRELRSFRELMEGVRDVLNPTLELEFGTLPETSKMDYAPVDLDALYRDTGFTCQADFESSVYTTGHWLLDHQ